MGCVSVTHSPNLPTIQRQLMILEWLCVCLFVPVHMCVCVNPMTGWAPVQSVS